MHSYNTLMDSMVSQVDMEISNILGVSTMGSRSLRDVREQNIRLGQLVNLRNNIADQFRIEESIVSDQMPHVPEPLPVEPDYTQPAAPSTPKEVPAEEMPEKREPRAKRSKDD